MKRYHMSGYFCLALCLLLVGVMLAGAAFATTEVTYGYELPLCEPGSVTLTYLVVENGASVASKTSNLPITRRIQELTGVTLAIEAVPSSDLATVRSTRLASQTELPDILQVGGGPNALGEQGVFLDITPYIDQYDTYMEMYLSYEPDTESFIRSAGGRIYGWPAITTGTERADPYGFMIRGDWLEKIGVTELPKTIDDWEHIFELFMETDLNGDGDISDEVPFCANSLFVNLVWRMAYDLSWRAMPYEVSDDGVVTMDYLSDKNKEFLIKMADWYAKGYIDREFLTVDQGAKITNNKVGSFVGFSNNSVSRTEMVVSGGCADGYYVGVTPPYAEGYEGGIEEYGPIGDWTAITTACENPDVAFKFCDWVWGSPEATTLLWFGVEGEHWTPDENGKPNYNSDFFADGETSALVGIGGHTFFFSIRSAAGPWSVWADAQIAAYGEGIRATSIANMGANIVKKYPGYALTAEEVDTLSIYETDVNTYNNEMTTKFITGELDVEAEWETFIATMKNYGADEMVAVKQAQYDRFNVK